MNVWAFDVKFSDGWPDREGEGVVTLQDVEVWRTAWPYAYSEQASKERVMEDFARYLRKILDNFNGPFGVLTQ